jgi:hypothetical protein
VLFARGNLAPRRQSPVKLRIRLHPEAHEVHWSHRSELARTGAPCCATPGPPKSQPTDQERAR